MGVLIIAAGLLIYVSYSSNLHEISVAISNYEECAAAGYPIMESYPEQCATPDGRTFTRIIEEKADLPQELLDYINEKKNDIVLERPQPQEVVTSPLVIKGRARGTWFFEGYFPVTLVNWDGLIIAESIASLIPDLSDPESTWMTEDFVSFEGTIVFDDPSWDADFSKRGTLILQKENPSGSSEFDDALEIPILFFSQN